MKTIVTHLSPDVDAATSVWVIRRFLPGWENAPVAFVPAGSTLGDEPVDANDEILHVDTGMGKLDHHQTDEDTCAAKRTVSFIADVLKHASFPDAALVRLTDVVNDIDHFREVYFPNPMADFYDGGIVAAMDGWRLLFGDDHQKTLDLALVLLDGIYRTFQNKVWAQEEIERKAVPFQTRWGKGLGIETINDETVRIAQRMGYTLAVRKDPKKDFVRIKSQPESTVNLENTYHALKKADPQATWYLHVSRKMLLNGSVKNPKSVPTKLTLREIIDVLKKNGSREKKKEAEV